MFHDFDGFFWGKKKKVPGPAKNEEYLLMINHLSQ